MNVLQSSAWADASCSVPVCDIPAAIAALRTDTQNQRYQTVSSLRESNKHTVDPASLQNLMDFAKQAQDLFVSIHEDDWLIREATELYAFAVDGLLKYARPISSARMISLFADLTNEDQRFDVLVYWTTEVQQLNSPADIQQVMAFAHQAVAIVTADQDSDYVGRQAQMVLSQGTDRYNQLHPYFEGLYKIQIQCSAVTTQPECPSYMLDGFHRLVILDSQNASPGVRISIVSDASGDAAISFDHAVFDADQSKLTALTNVNEDIGPTRDIELTIDPVTGQLQGIYEDSQYEGKFLITGTVIKNIGQELTDIPPAILTADQIVGEYQGTLAGIPGSLVVKSLSQGQLSASFVASATRGDLPSLRVDFQVGRWIPTEGLLLLVGTFPQARQEVKLVLAYRASPISGKAPYWRGFEFAQYGRSNPATFNRVAPAPFQ